MRTNYVSKVAFCSWLICQLVPSIALAVPNNAVYEGSSVVWQGSKTSPNVLLVYNGFGEVNGSNVSIAGGTLNVGAATGFVWDVSSNTPNLVANSPYYVYYAQYPDLLGHTQYTMVISTVAPYPEGYPSSNLKFTVSTNPQAITQNATYLGSFMSDNNANIIPFRRAGQDVILYGAGTNAWSNNYNAIGVWTSTSCATFPCMTTTNLVNSLPASIHWPNSASALIVNITASTTGATAPFMGIFDNLALPVSGNTSWLPAFVVSPTSTSPVTYGYVRIPFHTSNQIEIGDAVKPAAGVTDTLSITLVGYSEAPTRLQ